MTGTMSDDRGNPAVPNLDEPFLTTDVAKMALDSANVGIWILDTESRKFQPSARTKQLFGFSPVDDMSFEDALLKVSDKYRRAVLKTIEEAIKLRSSVHVECPVLPVMAEKNQQWLSITGGFSTVDANSNYFSGIVVDITEQKQSDLRRSKFIGIVSHELKTPLTALKAYVQMLNNWAKKQKDNFSLGALSKAEKQVRKMLNMINSLLNLSSAEAGKIHLTKQIFSLHDLINEVMEETMFITDTHQIILSPCEGVMINGDHDKIEQVIVNLLSNAAKYSAAGSPIRINCTVEENDVTVSICDQGMGISPQNIEKLFLPHYRVESKETEKIEGFGIGLYLCSEIITRHKGKIWVDSKVGEGSTFNFTLPVEN